MTVPGEIMMKTGWLQLWLHKSSYPTSICCGEKEELESFSTTEKNGSTQEGTLPLTEEREFLSGIKLLLAIPRITNQFHSIPDVGWYGSAYSLTSASLQPLTGKLYTNISSKICSPPQPNEKSKLTDLGSLLCALAVNSRMLIIGRAIAGVGAAGLTNGALTILSACVPKQQLPISQLGIALGPILGGTLTEYVSWRWCFWINLPLGGVVAFFLILIHIPDQIIKEKLPFRKLLPKLDLLGFGIFLPSAIMFFLALQFGGNKFAWSSPTVIGLFVGSAITFIIFLGWEWRTGDKAMIPFSVMRKKIMWSSCITFFFYMGDIMVVGCYCLPVILVQMIFAVGVSGAVSKIGYLVPFMVACGVVMSVGDGLYTRLRPSTSTATWIGYQIISGCGNGLGTTIPIIAIQSLLPVEEQSIAIAILIFCQNFGGSVFLICAQTIFDNSLHKLIAQYVPGIDVNTVISAGATGWKSILSEHQIAGILRAYAGTVDGHSSWL
ncbi:MFS general substrate transporter [Stipitochalara longipes BDJ]|nr:MFS general substrate transporter [Stipitochalara longipes BDJ]